MEYIETRLAELEDEKKELKLFQRLDTQRRSIEYTIYEQELAETQEKLKDIAAMRQTWSEKTQKAHMNQQTAEKNRQDAEEEVRKYICTHIHPFISLYMHIYACLHTHPSLDIETHIPIPLCILRRWLCARHTQLYFSMFASILPSLTDKPI